MTSDIPRLHQRTEADRRAIHTAIMEGRRFKAGGMEGITYKGDPPSLSYLNPNLYPYEWQSRFNADHPSYVVWSFRYPIAWYVAPKSEGYFNKYSQQWSQRSIPGYWVVPAIKYKGRTTARHARIARVATILANPITSIDGERGDAIDP